ncbi:adenosyl-hopene transferase HpnH [Deltaproteobacteria bacterium PRO3]|nr:adenosyl-hopene transferase HpnH [Deltaproteobacteria bacterium PRO3]
MAVPGHQAFAIGKYLLKQRILGRKRYPLNLMLEPLFRCNLACPGCGKIQFPDDVLKKNLSVEQALAAAEECGAPMVTIPGGEPLIHPQIEKIVEGLLKQKRYVILCTNALLLERNLPKFKPDKRLTFSIHMDGYGEHHDHCVDREGTYDIAVKAIKAAIAQGHRVITNTTVFEGHSIDNLVKLFDHMMELGVEGLTISPGFSYEKAPDQDHFLSKKRTQAFFRQLLDYKREHKKKWDFNNSPFFMDFLEGKRDYECTPWGMPTYNVFGWQKPCYLLTNEGYAATFQEYMEATEWDKYGTNSGNPKCANCATHCGYEPSAVSDGMSSIKKMIELGRATAAGSRG